MARNPLRDRKKLSSNPPRVGAGEPGAAAATRRVEGARAAAAADADGPDLLGSVVEGVDELRHTLQVVRPETVVGWHRQGFRRYWAWKSRRRWGRPAIGRDLRDLIRQMSRANPLWGAPRIHGELLKLRPDCLAGDGVEVHGPASEAAVAGVANILEEPRRGSNRYGFLHGAYSDLSSPVRARGAEPRISTSPNIRRRNGRRGNCSRHAGW
jgi:hypothetical protein